VGETRAVDQWSVTNRARKAATPSRSFCCAFAPHPSLEGFVRGRERSRSPDSRQRLDAFPFRTRRNSGACRNVAGVFPTRRTSHSGGAVPDFHRLPIDAPFARSIVSVTLAHVGRRASGEIVTPSLPRLPEALRAAPVPQPSESPRRRVPQAVGSRVRARHEIFGRVASAERRPSPLRCSQ
jgi:hypothetical protein